MNSMGDAARSTALSVQRVPFLVSYLIAQWNISFGERPEQALACTEDQLAYLALCRRPRQERWSGDVEEIASRAGISPERLSQFLRAAEAADAFARAHSPDEEVDGRLMAARDRDEDD